MRGIGGNITAELQIGTTVKNEIGGNVKTWKTIQKIKGWLDLMSGEAKRTAYNAKIEESTHIFVADYVRLDPRITAEGARLVIGNSRYDITLIDNPMGLGDGSQWELYLKYTGGQNG